MPTQTDNLALELPVVGASRDTWGTTLNQNFTKIDTVMPIGCVLDFAGPSAPPGWLICDGRLISRTTYSDLFAAISTTWGAGDGTTTFKLPNAAGRASVGPGAVTDASGHVTGFAFAEMAGNTGVSLAQANLPNVSLPSNTTGAHAHNAVASNADRNHTHTGTTHYTGHEGDHQHTVPNTTSGATPTGSLASGAVPVGGPSVTSVDGQHQHTLDIDPAGVDHTHAILLDSQGDHSHTVSLGGSAQVFSVIQPVIVFNKIIFAGHQAAPGTLLAATAAPGGTPAAPLRGNH